MGDGVCHLASLFYWAAKDAGIEALAPVNHDFAVIPQIDKKYGVAIYADPTNATVSMQQNLYIKNTYPTPITFRVSYNGTNLSVEILKQA
jgi:vancomycin resistance protein YoaR